MSKPKRAGSLLRDTFNFHHHSLGPGFYACDVDLGVISKRPEGIVAFYDVKRPGEALEFAHILFYNRLLFLAPIYIIEGTVEDAELGRFRISKYLGGDWRPRSASITTG